MSRLASKLAAAIFSVTAPSEVYPLTHEIFSLAKDVQGNVSIEGSLLVVCRHWRNRFVERTEEIITVYS